ncbi:Helix-turn-helix protein [Thiomonas sp. X19]|uniref:P-loop NTPase n=1 Tax=Thiomonas sp. X19 TaxID=1050370 RepID=UPI000B68499D|nr:helix-turn-helix domain-containing protein [Thiomonas sp. X19]SCC90967.1 Helix-turn-helix protein [Thiomonas sp. X19]
MKKAMSPAPYAAFGELLAQRRVEAGFAKQQELAVALDIRQQSVSRWEKGLGRPRATEIPALEKLVKAQPNELLAAAGFAQLPTIKPTGPEAATSFDRALPLSALSPETFESFCTALLSRLYRVQHGDVHRYGGAGSKQHGIDITARGPFGVHSFQCKRVNEFGAQKVHKAVGEQTYEANLKVLLLSCVASPKARDAIVAHKDWQLWDREDITRKLHELPLADRLDLVDRYFSGQRFDLLGIAKAGPFQSIEEYFKPFLVEGRFFNHSWALVGRRKELDALTTCVKNESARITCLLGAAGSGKSRLLLEVVNHLVRADKSLSIRFVSSTEEVKAHHLDALRSSRGDKTLLVVDDAHERDDLGILLRYAADPDHNTRLLLSLRPYGQESLRHQAANVSLLPPAVQFVALAPPTVESAVDLASSVLLQCHASVEAAAGIASATYPTPLVTVLAAQLVARDEIPVALLSNADDLCAYVLPRLQDVITGSLVTGQDAEKLRAVLRVVALVQPFFPDDPALLAALSILEGIDKVDATKLLRLLNDAGVLFKRGLRWRLAPDLLADDILKSNYISPEGSINERAVQFFEQATVAQLKNMFVNLGRLDWRRRDGKTDESKLLDSLQPLLKWGDKYDNPHVEAVEAVAYYQPRFALAFATKLIKEGHGDCDKVCYIARNAAFTYDHLEEACLLLWRAGRNDQRPLNQNPGHGIRLLTELAEFGVNKPIAYVEGVVNFALGLLERPASLSGTYSPFSILEGALATEMQSTSYSHNAYTITRYRLPLQQAKEVRQQIASALLRFITAEPHKRALLAARTLSHALRSPMHGDESDGAWSDEHLHLLSKVRTLLKGVTVHPVVLVELAKSVSWHAFFSSSETRNEARAILWHLERDLRTRTIRVLIDGWGSETWEFNASHEREGVEEYREQVTSDLLSAFLEPAALLDELGSCLEDIGTIAGDGYGSPFMFMNHLLAAAPGLARELVMQDIEKRLNERLRPHVGQALSIVIASNEVGLLQRFLAGSHGSDPALARVAEAYVRFTPSRPYNADEVALFRRICKSDVPDLLVMGARLVRQVSHQNAGLALELACSMQFDVCAPATHEVLMWLASTKDLSPSDVDTRRRDLLRNLERLERIDDYWVVEFLKKSTERDPVAVVELMKARLGTSGKGRRWNHIFFTGGHQSTGLGLQITSLGTRLLKDLLDWALVECTEPSATWSFGNTVSTLWGSYDQSLLNELLNWMSGGTEEHARLVAAVLENAQQTIIYESPGFVDDILEMADLIGDKALASIRYSLASATQSGVRSGIPGEPFAEDVRLEEHCKARLDTLGRTAPAYELYDELLKRARDSIAQQRHMKEAMGDEDE